jgi:uncharacterized tellurite resistance protein B-like protein
MEMYRPITDHEYKLQEEKLTAILEYLDKEVNILLDASTEDEVHKQIRISILSEMSLKLMKEVDEEFTKTFIKLLEQIIPSSHKQFSILIGSCMLLAGLRLYESDKENKADEYSVCLADVVGEVY